MTSLTSAIQTPNFTGSVNQQFFIEPQQGSVNPISYLDAFPDTLYNKSIDSRFIALMYAILGPAGLGWLKQNYLLARLQFEDSGFSLMDLDALYSNPLTFARLASETPSVDPTGLLTAAQWQQIHNQDSAYRSRAINFLNAVRAGGTLLGITLAAESGLNRPVEVIENYRALYDRYSDNPLGLDYLGRTLSTEEIVVIPRNPRPVSAVQTITVTGVPSSGTFTLTYPAGSTANTTTAGIAYNATRDVVQAALEALPVIGAGNTRVTGGPLPATPIQVAFTNALADRAIPTLIPNTTSLTNSTGAVITMIITVNQVGANADGELAQIAPQDLYYMQKAINRIKPMTTIPTPGQATGTTKRQPFNTAFAASTFIQVLRYVTGQTGVPWQPVDSVTTGASAHPGDNIIAPVHWIEAAREHEGPLSQFGAHHHYVNFHAVVKAQAYTESALKDVNYTSLAWPTVQGKYNNEHIGTYSAYQAALYPVLAPYTDPSIQFRATNASAATTEPVVITTVSSGGAAIINDIYPIDYQGLPGITQIPTQQIFWSSVERPTGTDYIELDLGAVQMINYLTFQATRKPYDIAVAYDLLDAAPSRNFLAVSLANQALVPSVTAIGYDASAVNPWENIEIHFNNPLGYPVCTRFIRIGFTRRTGGNSPFVASDGTLLPYSIEVQNLRIGRNIA